MQYTSGRRSPVLLNAILGLAIITGSGGVWSAHSRPTTYGAAHKKKPTATGKPSPGKKPAAGGTPATGTKPGRAEKPPTPSPSTKPTATTPVPTAIQAAQTPPATIPAVPEVNPAAAAKPEGAKWALLVGIHKYPDSELAGCDLDVQHMRDLLTESYHFPADHIILIQDLDATKANIVQGLTDLAGKAGPNDAAVFYYSGHGTQVPDLSGEEEDGWDEAIVPAEPVPNHITSEDELKKFLLDKELAQLVDRFKTKNLTLIFDSCHSGGATRAAEIRQPRGLPMARERHFEFSPQLLERAREARQQREAGSLTIGTRSDAALVGKRYAGSRYVFIAGCQPWETSGGTLAGGMLTNALVPALQAGTGKNWDQIMLGVTTDVADHNFSQHPDAEGAVERYPFSVEEAAETAPYYRPRAAIAGAIDTEPPADKAPFAYQDQGANGHQQALVAGAANLYVEQIGGLYDVYPAADHALQGPPRGRIKITGSRERVQMPDGGDPRTMTVADIVAGSVKFADQIVPVSVPVPSTRAKVGLLVDDDSPDAAKLRVSALAIDTALRARPEVQVMDTGKISEMDYAIQPQVRDGDLTAVVWTAAGRYLTSFTGTPDVIAQNLAQFVGTRHAALTRLVRLYNPSAPFRMSARVDNEGSQRQEGDTITIHVGADVPVYLTIITASEHMAPRVIVATDQPVPVDREGTLTLHVPAGILSGAEEKGHFAIKILATTKPLGITTSDAGDVVDHVAAALKTQLGDGGGTGNLATEGWAESTIWIGVQK